MEKHGELRFRGGDVHGKVEDELETIDGREPRASAVDRVAELLPAGRLPRADDRRATALHDRLQALLRQRVPLRLDDDDVVRLTSEPRDIDDQS